MYWHLKIFPNAWPNLLSSIWFMNCASVYKVHITLCKGQAQWGVLNRTEREYRLLHPTQLLSQHHEVPKHQWMESWKLPRTTGVALVVLDSIALNYILTPALSQWPGWPIITRDSPWHHLKAPQPLPNKTGFLDTQFGLGAAGLLPMVEGFSHAHLWGRQ